MALELTCDSLALTGVARRQIPMLYRYSSVNLSIPHAAATRITTDTVLSSQSVGSTGFVWESPSRLRNTSGRTLLVRVSYSLVWVSVIATRTVWVQVDDTAERVAMTTTRDATSDPSQSGSAIISVPHNSTLTLWAYQNSGFSLPLVAKYGLPCVQLTII